jgi:hypothetical protein
MCQFDLMVMGFVIYHDAFINIFSNNELIFDLSDPSEIDYGSILTLNFVLNIAAH